MGEETGLKDLSIVEGFRRPIRYFYRREGKNVHKEVVYFLARTSDDEVKISSEHQGFGWYAYDEAVKKTSYDNSQATLAAAEKFLAQNWTKG